MKGLTLLFAVTLLMIGSPATYQGKYHAYSSFGPHSWHQLIKISSNNFSSEEWRTGFFDRNNQITTGRIKIVGDTLLLVPKKISFYVPIKLFKHKRPLYIKKTCNYTAFITDTTTIKNYKLNQQKIYNQELCREGYELLMTGDSLTIVERLADGEWFKRGFRKITDKE